MCLFNQYCIHFSFICICVYLTDVCGILVKVKPTKIATNWKGGKKDVREITIVNNE